MDKYIGTIADKLHNAGVPHLEFETTISKHTFVVLTNVRKIELEREGDKDKFSIKVVYSDGDIDHMTADCVADLVT
jgi:hypothetical protein